MEGRDVRADPRPGARPGPAAGPAAAAGGHQIVLRERQQATIGGVLHVASFDASQIVLDTELGTLTLLGHDLQIRQLDLAQGTFWVDGVVDSLAYAAPRRGSRGAGTRRGGMLGRLFR